MCLEHSPCHISNLTQHCRVIVITVIVVVVSGGRSGSGSRGSITGYYSLQDIAVVNCQSPTCTSIHLTTTSDSVSPHQVQAQYACNFRNLSGGKRKRAGVQGDAMACW